MARKLRFHSLHFLFRMFAYLADKSGGWYVFVKPKLVLGTMIVGLGFTACGTKMENNNTPAINRQPSKKSVSMQSLQSDTLNKKSNKETQSKRSLMRNHSSFVTCYDFEIVTADSVTPISKDSVRDSKMEISCYQVMEDIPYTQQEQMPQFPGGDQALSEFLSKNIQYPKNAQDAGIEGVVILRFFITKMGLIDNVEVEKSLSSECDKEAIRLIKSSPKWIPGVQNGARVKASYSLSISFTLN